MKFRKILPCLIALPFLNALQSARAQSPTFNLMYTFTATNATDLTNMDGADSQAALARAGNTVYGTTYFGGNAGNGTIFSVTTVGSSVLFSNLHSFTATNGPNAINTDGANPIAGLLLSGNTLYGTAQTGGTGGSGTVFKINTDGTQFATLYNFSLNSGNPFYANGDGAFPAAGLVLSGNTLYGATQNGGSGGVGTIFSISTTTSNFSLIHSFAATSGTPNYTNSDGAYPGGTLILLGGTLYGTTESAGPLGNGTVFKINTDTTGFSNMHSFTFTSSAYPYTNSDGAVPLSGMVVSGPTLYGTTYFGGGAGVGGLFKINTDGSGFTNIHNFSATNGPIATNTDGAQPVGGLLAVGSTLYGTAGIGGSGGSGTVFSLNTDGSDFSTLYNFTPTSSAYPYTNSDGAAPLGALLLSGTTAYSTTAAGGSAGNGTVFALLNLSLPATSPILTIVKQGAEFVITWPTTASNFVLQTTPVLPTASWSNITSGITISGPDYVYTQPFTGTERFFRLQEAAVTVLPKLSIAKAGAAQAVISWPSSASNFVLQTTPNLNSKTWSNITSGITTIGSNFVLTNALTGQAAFFRLEQQ